MNNIMKESYKEYPSLVNLFCIMDETNNKEGHRYISSTITEYNEVLNKVLNDIKEIKFQEYLGKIIKLNFTDRIKNDCRCLNTLEKNHLICYIVGRHRNKFLRKKL